MHARRRRIRHRAGVVDGDSTPYTSGLEKNNADGANRAGSAWIVGYSVIGTVAHLNSANCSPSSRICSETKFWRLVGLDFRESFRVLLEPDLVFPAPFTHRLEGWSECHAVGRNRITDVWRNAPFFMSQKYSVRHHFLQMADQHPLCYLWYASSQLASTHGPIEQSPQNRSFPSSIDDRQHRIDRAG